MKHPILEHFQYDYLPSEMHPIAKSFADQAQMLVDELPHSALKSITLKLLMSAKDTALKSMLKEGETLPKRPTLIIKVHKKASQNELSDGSS